MIMSLDFTVLIADTLDIKKVDFFHVFYSSNILRYLNSISIFSY